MRLFDVAGVYALLQFVRSKKPEQNCSHRRTQVGRRGNDSREAPLFFWQPADTRRRQRRIPMELILIIVVVVLLFGGGGYWGRRRGHW